MLSSGLVGDPDEENLRQLRDSPPDELQESRYVSGSTDCNPSSGDLSVTSTLPGMSGVTELRYGESSWSAISTLPQCSSIPGGYGIQYQLSCETAAAVAGIPSMQSNLCSSSLHSGSLSSSGVQCTHSQRTQPEQFSGGSYISDKSRVVSYHGSTPQQVEDDDEQQDWDPINDVMHRISSKIKFLMKSIPLHESDVHLLSIAKGIYYIRLMVFLSGQPG